MAFVTEQLVVIGGGGFAREVLDVVEAINADQSTFGAPRFEVVGVLADPAPDEVLLGHYGVKYLGSVDLLDTLPPEVGYVVGIGDGAARRDIDQRGGGRDCPVLVHPSATVGRMVDLGAGTVVCSHVSITNHVTTGRHVHLNLNSTVGHDAVLGDYVTVSPLVAISGNVTIGDACLVGTGAAINEKLTIGDGATVGSGAAVVRDVGPGATVVGIPARPVSR